MTGRRLMSVQLDILLRNEIDTNDVFPYSGKETPILSVNWNFDFPPKNFRERLGNFKVWWWKSLAVVGVFWSRQLSCLLPWAMSFYKSASTGAPDFNQLISAVVRHNLGIGREHKIKDMKQRCLYISSSKTDKKWSRMLSLLTHQSCVVQMCIYAILRRWMRMVTSPALFVGAQ